MAHSGFDEIFGIKKESTPGTFETGEFATLPYSSCTLKTTRETLESNRLGVPNRFGTRLGAKNVSGDLGNEFVNGPYDDLIAAAIGGSWVSDVVKSGRERASFSCIRKKGTLGLKKFRGVEVSTMQIEIGQNAAVTLNFGLIGTEELTDRSATGITFAAMTEDYPITGYDVEIRDGGTLVAIATGATINCNRNTTASFVLGTYVTGDKSVGKTLIDGSLTIQLVDFAYEDDFQNETRKDLTFTLKDPFTNSERVFDMPNVLLTSASDDTTSDAEVPLVLNFFAEYDPTEDTAMSVTRVDPV